MEEVEVVMVGPDAPVGKAEDVYNRQPNWLGELVRRIDNLISDRTQ